MATKLNQILAVEKGVKNSTYAETSKFYKTLQKKEPLSGIARNYTPKDDDGDQLPSESTKLQVRAEDVLDEVRREMVKLFDVTFAKDATNTRARADVVVDGTTLVADVPVTYLLFLEKQLGDLAAIIKAIPVLDPTEEWHYDAAQDAFATEPIKTTRTKKVPRNHVKAEATEKHPAQVEMYFEDVIVGTWSTVRYSGAVSQARVNRLREKVEKLSKAVKYAREQANQTEVVEVAVGKAIFDYLLGE
jgi:hypothetical protein